MNKSKTMTSDRIIFLDNLRYVIIALIVFYHSACSFIPGFRWWANDPSTNLFFGILVTVMSVFLMPVLFFLSGYFVIESYNRRGFLYFIKSKVKLLLLPLLLFAFLINPLISYFRFITIPESTGSNLHNFFSFWLHNIQSALSGRIGTIKLEYVMKGGFFSIQHLWFLSIIFILFFLSGIILYLKRRFFIDKKTSLRDNNATSLSVLLSYLIFAAITFITFYSINYLYSDFNLFGRAEWFMITPLCLFQYSRLPIYILYFLAGIYAFSRGWFETGNGRLYIWLILALISFLPFMKSMSNYYGTGKHNSELLFIYSLSHVLFCLSVFGIFINISHRFMNTISFVKQKLSENSYNIYLVHFPVVIFLQHIFSLWNGGNPFIKFILIASMSFIISFVTSNYIIKPNRFRLKT
jgi:glucan biosynthesis protein C